MTEVALIDFIDQTRRMKHVSIQALGRSAGLSSSTYKRLREGQAELKIHVLMNLMTALRLEMSDIDPYLADDLLTTQTTLSATQELINAIVRRQVPPSAMSAHSQRLRAVATRSGLPGDDLQAQYAELMEAKLTGDVSAAERRALDLYGALTTYTAWTGFEYQLILPCISFLAYTQLKRLAVRFFGATMPVVSAVAAEAVDDDYMAMLSNVIATRQSAHVGLVIGWMQARKTQADRMKYQLYLRFAHIVEQALLVGAAKAEGQYRTLQTVLLRIWPDQDCPFASVFTRLWAQVERLSRVRHLSTPAVPSGVPMPLAAPLENFGALVSRYRQAKRERGDALRKALYVSKSAFYRFFSEGADAKLTVLMAAFDYLRIDGADLVTALEATELPLAAAARETFALVDTPPTTAIELQYLQTQIASLKTQAAATGNVGFAQLATLVEITWLHASDAPLAEAKAIAALYADLTAYDSWNAFEYRLVIRLLPGLDFKVAAFLFDRLIRTERTRSATINGLTPEDLDAVYMGLLQSALRSGVQANIQQATAWIMERRTPSTAIGFRLSQAVVRESMSVQEAEVRLNDTDLENALCALFPASMALRIATRVRLFWQDVA
ncbi:hypothetical protein [Lacticaseibacillus absianus]|uniref:hypothetical protein n=1 Tax=Lacticaseibacillus absianus TaxID=2729623 RepID=UPI0015C95A9F|nr:hypothetical protein [Lacticaseibacillus absianus]